MILYLIRQHKILYSSQATQDSILVTGNTRSYTWLRQYETIIATHITKITILATDNTRFLYSSQTTQDSILVTDNTKFYTCHRLNNILYSLDNPRFLDLYSPQTTHRFLYSPRTTQYLYFRQTSQDSILTTDNTEFYTRHRPHKDLYIHHR